MIVMLFVFGRRHPRVFDEDVPLDRTRLLLALFALVMFVALLHAGADPADRPHQAVTSSDFRLQISESDSLKSAI